MDIIVKQEIGRSIPLYFIIFIVVGNLWKSGRLNVPAYMVFVITLVITILTIPPRVWFRRWLNEKRS